MILSSKAWERCFGVLLWLISIASWSSEGRASQHCRVERVSVSSSGVQASSDSFQPRLSADGTLVCYTSLATNLVPDDTNGTYDVFAFDRRNRKTERVSVGTSGQEANSASANGILSADGRWVVFDSGATNLDAGDNHFGADVYLRDRREGSTVLISRRLDEYSSAFGCSRPSMSSDGRFIAFLGADDNVVPGDRNRQTDVFVHDRESGITEIVSLWNDGVPANDASMDCAVTDDGRYVAFICRATNWGPIVPYPYPYAYRRDRSTGITEIVNIKPDGSPSYLPVAGGLDISPDGRYVAYVSHALDVTGQGSSGFHTVFVRNMLERVSEPVSMSPTGGRANSASEDPSFTHSGRTICFQSDASNLVLLDEDYPPGSNVDVFVRNLDAGTTTLVSIGDHGQSPNNGGLGDPAISGDGRVVAFSTNADNLVPGDTGYIFDIYVVECDNSPVMHYCESQPNSLGCFPILEVDGQPSVLDDVPFRIRAENLLSGSEGFFLYGVAGSTGMPVIGGGWLCVQPPFQRMRWQPTRGELSHQECNGTLYVDFDAWVRSGIDPALAVGTTVFVQAWSLDPSITHGTSLTDAITFEIAP